MNRKLADNQWVAFCIENERYVLPVREVKEVIHYSAPNMVPGAENDVIGMLDVRGEVITVLSSRRLLSLEEKPPNNNWRIIILELQEAQLGLCVDSVDQILSFDTEDIQSNFQASTSEFIVGSVQIHGALHIVLDFKHYVLDQNI